MNIPAKVRIQFLVNPSAICSRQCVSHDQAVRGCDHHPQESRYSCPNNFGAHLILAVTYSESGREEEAPAEAAEVLRLSPQLSLEGWRQRLPFKDPAVLERTLVALRKAGLK